MYTGLIFQLNDTLNALSRSFMKILYMYKQQQQLKNKKKKIVNKKNLPRIFPFDTRQSEVDFLVAVKLLISYLMC